MAVFSSFTARRWNSSMFSLFCQMFKIFQFKQEELKAYAENTEALPSLIFCLIRRKYCFFFCLKHDMIG